MKIQSMEPDSIVIAFCISDSFIRHTAVVIASILEHNPREHFVFHVLCGDLSADNRAKLAAMESTCASIVCHDITQEEERTLPTLVEHVSREAYFRFRIPEIIDAPRVIYSDVDVLVRGPLRPLWETDLQGMPLGAVHEPMNFRSRPPDDWFLFKKTVGMKEGNNYCYSGLLLMDCDKLRAEHATERLFEDAALCMKTLSPIFFAASDQVVINRVFQGRIFPLPARYCMTKPMIELFPKEPIVFRHYMGYYEKPWRNVAWNRTWFPYLRFLLRTPWRNEAWRFVLGHLWSIVWSVHTKNGNTRAFLFGLRVFKRAVRRTLGPRRVFLTFADRRLDKTLRRIRREAEAMGAFDEIRVWDERNLSPAFRARWANKLRPDIRGFGYWVWKPEIILRTLDGMKEGEILLYVDAGCRLIKTGQARLEVYFKMAEEAPRGIVAVDTSLENADRYWCKGDLLDYFGVRDRPDLLDTPSIQDGTIFVRKCPQTMDFIRRWAAVWEEDFALVDDSPSHSPDLPGFREHRHDQAVFSLLAKMAGDIVTIPGTECNPTKRLPSGSPDWSTMSPVMPIWHRRDKAFHYPLRWHLLRLASRIAPRKETRRRLRETYRAIPPKHAKP